MSGSDLARRAPVNAALVLGARTVTRLVSLVTVIAMGRHLGPAAYGRFTTVVVLSGLLSVLADLGLATIYTRSTARAPEATGANLATALAAKAALTVPALGVFLAVLAYQGLGGLGLGGALVFAASGLSLAARNTFYARGRAAGDAVAILLETGVITAGIWWGVRHGAGPAYFLAVYAAAYTTVLVFSLALIRWWGLAPAWRIEPARLRAWLPAALPVAGAYLLTNLYFRADVPLLQHFRPSGVEVGWYQLGYKLFEALQYLPTAAEAVIFPVVAGAFAAGGGELAGIFGRFGKLLIAAGWPLAVGILVCAGPIGRLAGIYGESVPALRILGLALPFLFFNSAVVAMLYGTDRQAVYMAITGAAAAANITGNLLLMPAHGYLAASWMTVAAEALISLLGVAALARHQVPWARLLWRPLVAGIAMGVVLAPLSSRSALISVPAGAAVYLAVFLGLGGLDREERAWIGARLRRRPALAPPDPSSEPLA